MIFQKESKSIKLALSAVWPTWHTSKFRSAWLFFEVQSTPSNANMRKISNIIHYSTGVWWSNKSHDFYRRDLMVRSLLCLPIAFCQKGSNLHHLLRSEDFLSISQDRKALATSQEAPTTIITPFLQKSSYLISSIRYAAMTMTFR